MGNTGTPPLLDHLLIPQEAWVPHHEAMEAKIGELLERDGALSYSLSLVGVKRQE